MATTKRKHPNTYRVGRRPLSMDGKILPPGTELQSAPEDGQEPETMLMGGQSYYRDHHGLFIRDTFGQRWDVNGAPPGAGLTHAVLAGRKETAQERLDRLVARGDVLAPGEGPDDKEKNA